MTVENRAQHITIAGAAVVEGVGITVNWDVQSVSELAVLYGNDQQAKLNADYTVSLAGNYKSAVVTPLAGLVDKVNGGTVTITSAVPYVQAWSVPINSRLPENDLQRTEDRDVLRDRQLFERLGLSLSGYFNNDDYYDARSKRIIGLNDPVDDSDAVTKRWVEARLASIGVPPGAGVLPGGVLGDVFTKLGPADFEADWRALPPIDPRNHGAVPTLNDETTIANNTTAFQTCLDLQTSQLRPIIIPGTFFVGGPLFPTSRLTLLGSSRYLSFLRFDARLGGADRDCVLFDFDTNDMSGFGSIIDSVGFKSEAGKDSPYKHTCFQFRTNGSANQLIVMSRFYADGWSDAFAEIPQCWNCRFSDFYLVNCGRDMAVSGWSKEGAGIRVGFESPQNDIITTGNNYTNGYINSCNHGISHQDEDVGQNLVLFNQFNNIICEFNRIGIYAPTSRDCYLRTCYFEANTFHGAVMGHAFIEGCRHRPDGTDDIVIDHSLYPWQPGVSHHEYFCSEEVCFEGTDGIHEIWSPQYGIIAFASPNPDFRGLVAVQTMASPAGTILAGFGPSFQIQLLAADVTAWPGKITLCIPGDGTLKIQNRSGATLEWTYHVIGGKQGGGPSGTPFALPLAERTAALGDG